MPQLRDLMLRQRGHLFGWVPVFLAVGIGCYFSVQTEPSVRFLMGVAGCVAICFMFAIKASEVIAPLAMACALIAAGFVLAAVRSHAVAEPVLGWRYYGPVEGRVVAMDRSQSDALRLTLDRVRLNRVPPHRTPDRVRVSLLGKGAAGIAPAPGLRVMTTAHLSPPSGPVEPGGFDFQRHAWFARLGAVGYARIPLMGVAPAVEGHAGLAVFRIRMAAAARIRDVLPGDIGGLAAAITTGDRSAISQDTLTVLRISNLAHLLAISGLHMGLLTAVVFGALRVGLALVPHTALHWPTRAVAAGGALVAASGYLMLSGASVSTERAFVMVAVALGALMIGRRAISLRAVAIAATIVLILRPEALMGPGFQMSFAATTALVAVFGWLRDSGLPLGPRWIRPAVAVTISSAVAGAATAPIAAAHFNAIAHYGLIANLSSVPLMGALVMPAAVLALVLSPLGLEALGLSLMGLGLRWIVWVAQTVAGWEGARGFVPGPSGAVLPLITLGFLFVILWQGRLRWGGVVAVVAGFMLWHVAQRPALLIADTGTLVGVMTPQGRALSKAKGAGFVARNWLETDGDGAAQPVAAARWRGRLPGAGKVQVLHLSGKRAVAGFTGCDPGGIVVASVEFAAVNAPDCEVFDPARLKQTGAIAIYREAQNWRMITARALAGERLWTNWPKPEADQ